MISSVGMLERTLDGFNEGPVDRTIEGILEGLADGESDGRLVERSAEGIPDGFVDGIDDGSTEGMKDSLAVGKPLGIDGDSLCKPVNSCVPVGEIDNCIVGSLDSSFTDDERVSSAPGSKNIRMELVGLDVGIPSPSNICIICIVLVGLDVETGERFCGT